MYKSSDAPQPQTHPDFGQGSKPSFDFAIIGTSPMCLIEACSLRAQGHSVCIFEASDRIGGAWYTGDVFGYSDIEMGPHFLVYSGGINFLRKLGLDIHQVKPTKWLTDDKAVVQFLSYGKAIRKLGWSMMAQAINSKLARLKEHKVDQPTADAKLFKKGWQHLWIGYKHSLLQPFTYYFRNGCGPVVRALANRARNMGVEIYLNCKITEADVPATGNIRLKSQEGGIFQTKELLITDRSRLDAVNINDQPLALEYKAKTRTQIHFLASTPPHPGFCVIRFFGNRYFVLSNLSEIYDQSIAPSGKAMLTMTLFDLAEEKSAEQIADTALEDLKQWGLLDPDAEFDAFQISHFDDTRLTSETRRLITRQSQKRIKFFGKQDLSKIVELRASLWRKRGIFKQR